MNVHMIIKKKLNNYYDNYYYEYINAFMVELKSIL
jgi:hypothetical protein